MTRAPLVAMLLTLACARDDHDDGRDLGPTHPPHPGEGAPPPRPVAAADDFLAAAAALPELVGALNQAQRAYLDGRGDLDAIQRAALPLAAQAEDLARIQAAQFDGIEAATLFSGVARTADAIALDVARVKALPRKEARVSVERLMRRMFVPRGGPTDDRLREVPLQGGAVTWIAMAPGAGQFDFHVPRDAAPEAYDRLASAGFRRGGQSITIGVADTIVVARGAPTVLAPGWSRAVAVRASDDRPVATTYAIEPQAVEALHTSAIVREAAAELVISRGMRAAGQRHLPIIVDWRIHAKGPFELHCAAPGTYGSGTIGVGEPSGTAAPLLHLVDASAEPRTLEVTCTITTNRIVHLRTKANMPIFRTI